MYRMFQHHRCVGTGVWLLLFFFGLILGVMIVQFQGNTAFAGIFSEYFLNQYSSLQVDYEKLLRYVGSYRCGQYAFLVCCCALTAAPALLNALVLIFGMTWGSVLSISTIRLGVKGIVICLAGVFPQICFYVPAFGWMFLWVGKGGNNRKKYLFLSVAGFLFLLFGILTEVYLNPLILQQILRKM